MDNPFKKRATEFITDASTLLPLISPLPINEFFKLEGKELFEKLTLVVGTPGSGKTTFARTLEFDVLDALSRDPKRTNPDLAKTLSSIGILIDNAPIVIAYRLPMSANFRGIWQLPYSTELKQILLKSFVQAKAVLGWFRQLERAEIHLREFKFVFSEDSQQLVSLFDINSPEELRAYARKIETAIFKAVTALEAPTERDFINNYLNERFDIFEYLEGVRITNCLSHEAWGDITLKPMLVIDDAHELHSEQYIVLRDWLKIRDYKVSRWVMCRPDIVSPEDYQLAMKEREDKNHAKYGTSSGRDYFIKLVQLSNQNKQAFRKLAAEIGARYLPFLTEFSKRSIKDLEQYLGGTPKGLNNTQIGELKEKLNTVLERARYSTAMVEALNERIPGDLEDDERLALLMILLEREMRKTPQLSLLAEDEVIDEPASESRKIKASLINGARIHLLHAYDRPYYFGIEKLADASNYNIEQFISLSGVLIDELLAKLIRGSRKLTITPEVQHKALFKQANQIINEWDFPYYTDVKRVIQFIAHKCIAKTLERSAPLDDGANAIGIPQKELDDLLSQNNTLTRILHFAFAYKALVFVPHYNCKGKEWCLLELGGIPCIAYGLTLGRGGFLEYSLKKLSREFDW